MDVDNKLIVNSAIQKLLEDPSDIESANIIIRFGHLLPTKKALTLEGSYRGMGGGNITGHTEEQGNINIETGEKNKTKEFKFGVEFERVGCYRMWKKIGNAICFQYFWKADIETSGISESPSVYALFYNKKLECMDFAEKIHRKIALPRSLFLVFGMWKSLQTGKWIYSEIEIGMSIRIIK